ncbi:uncharacterized protein [Nicotiana tomentosiformis]|uniref:uncharacterized protein n=1 Tax=Nicotiana tomentosiformis TaxID=4098 RepID=UPI00388CA148
MRGTRLDFEEFAEAAGLLREELRFQFEQLQQGQISVTDYEARFSELSRHALMILPTDAERVRIFVSGLHFGIQATMVREVKMGTSYELVVEIARRIEGVHQRSRERVPRDKWFHYYGGFSYAPSGDRGQLGRVGDFFVVHRIYRSCIMSFCGYETIADLLLLDMSDFEVILGMYWFSPYHAILDCHAKTVTLAMPELPRLEWKGSSVNASSRVIAFLKARHMVEKGCLAYLDYIWDTTTETPTIDSMSVVWEFSDVFPSDLPGMPPDCDIDFYIDLAPGTQPISIPLYRMAPKEFKDLKEQLEELLAKGFVRLSVSPWDRGPQFTSHFRRAVQSELGTRLDRFLPLAEYAYNNSYQSSIEIALFEALYGQRCRSPIGWFKPGEAKLYGNALVKDALEKLKLIQERLHTAQSRQKSYADQKACDLSFMVGEKVFLKVSSMKGIMRFGKNGKLIPRFIGPFEVLRRVGDFSYEFALAPSLSGVHLFFYVSMLRKDHANRSHVLDHNTVQLDESLHFEKEPVAIVDRQVRQLRSKKISTVKVQWRGKPVEVQVRM